MWSALFRVKRGNGAAAIIGSSNVVIGPTAFAVACDLVVVAVVVVDVAAVVVVVVS